MGPPGSLQDLLTCEPGLGVSRYHRAKQMLRHLLSEGLKVLADPYSGTGIGTRNEAKKSFQLSRAVDLCGISLCGNQIEIILSLVPSQLFPSLIFRLFASVVSRGYSLFIHSSRDSRPGTTTIKALRRLAILTNSIDPLVHPRNLVHSYSPYTTRQQPANLA